MLYIVIFYLLLLDSTIANILAWTSGKKWYRKNFRTFSRYFPLTKGWTVYYLILVIFIGIILHQHGVALF